MHITSKGQVTIPVEVREAMGFLPNTEVQFRMTKSRVYLEKVDKPSKRTQSLVSKMSGKATVNMSTDEILELTRGEK